MEHTILIVEDEKGIRETVTVFLKNQGYNVLQASMSQNKRSHRSNNQY